MLVHKIFVDGMERRMMLEKERSESGMMCRVVIVYICVCILLGFQGLSEIELIDLTTNHVEIINYKI